MEHTVSPGFCRPSEKGPRKERDLPKSRLGKGRLLAEHGTPTALGKFRYSMTRGSRSPSSGGGCQFSISGSTRARIRSMSTGSMKG